MNADSKPLATEICTEHEQLSDCTTASRRIHSELDLHFAPALSQVAQQPGLCWLVSVQQEKRTSSFASVIHSDMHVMHAKMNICACLTILPQMMEFWNLYDNPGRRAKSQEWHATQMTFATFEPNMNQVVMRESVPGRMPKL